MSWVIEYNRMAAQPKVALVIVIECVAAILWKKNNDVEFAWSVEHRGAFAYPEIKVSCLISEWSQLGHFLDKKGFLMDAIE